MTTQTDSWLTLTVPARRSLIPVVQAAAGSFAEQAGFTGADVYRVQLATEEVFGTILRETADEDDGGEVDVRLAVTGRDLEIELRSRGLPFDPSAMPLWQPEQVTTGTSEAGDADADILTRALPEFLVKSCVDDYAVRNMGRAGIVYGLAKRLPHRAISGYEDAERPALSAEAVQEAARVVEIRPLRPEDAIDVARLIWRSYGNSYVSEDLYFPERILALHRQGTLQSLVGVNAAGHVLAHLALMKDSADSALAEWGAVVVHPACRGQGLMHRLLEGFEELMATRAERAAFAHAVTNHPFTQRTCASFGYRPVTLQVGFAPASLSFRGISDTLGQRESTFISVRPVAAPEANTPLLYAPPRLHALLGTLVERLGTAPRWAATPPLTASDVGGELQVRLIGSCNIGMIQIAAPGADFDRLLARELRRLCIERVDVVYLYLDLAHPQAATAWETAERLGFFMAGVQPVEPFAWSGVLQYMNNWTPDLDAIVAVGPDEVFLRDAVKAEQARCAAESGAEVVKSL